MVCQLTCLVLCVVIHIATQWCVDALLCATHDRAGSVDTHNTFGVSACVCRLLFRAMIWNCLPQHVAHTHHPTLRKLQFSLRFMQAQHSLCDYCVTLSWCKPDQNGISVECTGCSSGNRLVVLKASSLSIRGTEYDVIKCMQVMPAMVLPYWLKGTLRGKRLLATTRHYQPGEVSNDARTISKVQVLTCRPLPW
jgi:hypothetical protein